MASGISSLQAFSPTILSIGNGPTYFGLKVPVFPLSFKFLVDNSNPISSLDFYCPIVLVSGDLVPGLGLLKLLPYSLPYCLHLTGIICGSWHGSSGEVQIRWELQLSSNHHVVRTLLSP